MGDRGRGSKRPRAGTPVRGDARVIQVNKRMALLGQQRQFSEVLKTFESLGHKGMQATEVTYNVLLYACVRCGELQHAKTFLAQMLERTDLKPNVVTYTTVLKGLCVEGDMKAAEDLLGQMVIRRLRPNTRTINMYLRGCLWTGDLSRASALWGQLSTLGVEPDFVSVDYMVRILANCFQVQDAQALQAAHPDMSIPTGQVHLASALALLADWAACQKALNKAREMLSEAPPVQSDADKTEQLELFQQHQQTELRAECNDLEQFVTNNKTHTSIEFFKHYLPRVWLFPHSVVTPNKLIPSLLERLCTLTAPAAKVLTTKYSNSLSSNKRLRFSRIFGSKQPVKLELCSGLGEWVTGMARAEPNTNWVACELRHDRCSTILAKMVTLHVSNLALFGGPAQDAIRYVKDAKVSEVFANFPEPPADRADASQNHLLNPGFIRSVHRVLKLNGKLTIVSDNLPYLGKLVREIPQEGFQLTLPPNATLVTNMAMIAKGMPKGYQAGSSYFDRFWRSRNKATRFYICFTKQAKLKPEAGEDADESEEGDEGDEGEDAETEVKSKLEANQEDADESEEGDEGEDAETEVKSKPEENQGEAAYESEEGDEGEEDEDADSEAKSKSEVQNQGEAADESEDSDEGDEDEDAETEDPNVQAEMGNSEMEDEGDE